MDIVRHLLVTADNNSITTGGASLIIIFRFGRAVGLVRVSAAGTPTVELDATAGTGDAVAFAGAAGGSAGDGAGSAGSGTARAERWDVGVGVGVRVVGVGVLIIIDIVAGKLGGELFESWGGESFGADHAGLLGLVGFWRDDLGFVQWAAFGNTTVGAHAARVARGLGGCCLDGGGGGGFASGNVEGVELTASGGLGDGITCWVVRDVVAIDDVVVPVALTLLEGLTLEAESALPAARLGGVLGERELAVVVVPRSEKVDRLAIGRSAEREVELDSGHF